MRDLTGCWQSPPAGVPALEAWAAYVAFSRDIGDDHLSLNLPDAKVTRFAERVALRTASNPDRITEPQRTIGLACFPKHRVKALVDGAIDIFNHRINDVARRARNRTVRAVPRQATLFQALVAQIDVLDT